MGKYRFRYFKTSTWNEYVFCCMSHSTYVISWSPQAKCYVLIWFKYLIPLTCLKIFRIPNGWWKLRWNRCLPACQMFPRMCQHRIMSKCCLNIATKNFRKYPLVKNWKFWLYFIFSLPKLFNLFLTILSIRVNPDQTWITWPLHVQHFNMEKVEWPTDANVQLGWFYLKERITTSAYSKLYFSNASRPG